MAIIKFEKKILTHYKNSKEDISKDIEVSTNYLIKVESLNANITALCYLNDKHGINVFYISVPIYRVWGMLADAVNSEKDKLKKPTTEHLQTLKELENEYLQTLKELENKSIPIPQMLYEAATKEEPVKKTPVKKDVKKPTVKKLGVKKTLVKTSKPVSKAKKPVAKKTSSTKKK